MLDTIGKDFKYKIIKNFLTEEERKLLSLYVELFHRHNYMDKELEGDSILSSNLDTFQYGDYLTDSLMILKRKLIEKEVNKNLLPTYTYFRVYTHGAFLKKHKDRPSCEISVTVNINSDKTPWPIYMDGRPVQLEPGEACVYLGEQVEHHREKFLGDWAMQVFMHFVDADGPNKDWYLDRRNLLGAKK